MPERHFRRVIKIAATDSPNVALGLLQQAAGQEPTNEILIPGVLPYSDYVKRLALWDPIRVCVGICGEFYSGASVLLFPPAWLNRAAQRADALRGQPRQAVALGIDPAEGGDATALAVVDRLGLIELASQRTPDTSVITSLTLAWMQRYNLPAEKVFFDRGGGGKQHADRLRAQGYPVQTVAFGEPILPELKRVSAPLEERKQVREEKYIYVNRRAELYGRLRDLLDPASDGPGFGIPAEYTELRRQLAPIPLTFDAEGRMMLLPKNKRDPRSSTVTLKDLLGCSPDEADALCLACFGLTYEPHRARAGAIR